MHSNSYAQVLERIRAALEASRAVLARFTPGAIEAEYKAGHDPVTEADRALDAVLRKELLRDGEGWLSEESVDDPIRLQRSHVWVVDPLDGTREFVEGIPEFCVSIGFVENGRPVAGGIYNPATDETFLGSIESGVTYNGKPSQPSQRNTLDGALVLASRSEVKRGEWKPFENAAFTIRPMGSVAYKLALVSAGLADVTFTLTPKNEWDVVAGAALVQSAGGFVSTLEKTDLTANRRDPLLSGLLASGPFLKDKLLALVEPYIRVAEQDR
ncbi:MAG: 3'(2'),5'-bisphosphate nucleotidase CysQ [Candidatus Sulfotelmatobacter sp.]|jgi:myo-inositol-1(or 4)-monophosphatase